MQSDVNGVATDRNEFHARPSSTPTNVFRPRSCPLSSPSGRLNGRASAPNRDGLATDRLRSPWPCRDDGMARRCPSVLMVTGLGRWIVLLDVSSFPCTHPTELASGRTAVMNTAAVRPGSRARSQECTRVFFDPVVGIVGAPRCTSHHARRPALPADGCHRRGPQGRALRTHMHTTCMHHAGLA